MRVKGLLVIILLNAFGGLNMMSQHDPSGSCYSMMTEKNYKPSFNRRPKTQDKLQVGVYFEVDYQAYLDLGSDVTLVRSWLDGLFEEIRSIYSMHHINLYISDVFIWTTADIYTHDPNNEALLLRFGDRLRAGFDGHVAQLLTTRPIGGGRAYLNSVCTVAGDTSPAGPYSVATALSTDLHRDASYSWSVYVMAHEIGHILGVPHTHSCFWGPNGDEALDNCFPTEGDCPPIASSAQAGSLMSYCFLFDRGIDFSLGLGTEPGHYMYNNLQSKECIQPCLGLACDDQNNCTIDDRLDADCNCRGTMVDINHNDICDLDEVCNPIVILNNISQDTLGYIARQTIMNYANMPPDVDVIMSAGEEIIMMPGATVPLGATYAAYLYGCHE